MLILWVEMTFSLPLMQSLQKLMLVGGKRRNGCRPKIGASLCSLYMLLRCNRSLSVQTHLMFALNVLGSAAVMPVAALTPLGSGTLIYHSFGNLLTAQNDNVSYSKQAPTRSSGHLYMKIAWRSLEVQSRILILVGKLVRVVMYLEDAWGSSPCKSVVRYLGRS